MVFLIYSQPLKEQERLKDLHTIWSGDSSLRGGEKRPPAPFRMTTSPDLSSGSVDVFLATWQTPIFEIASKKSPVDTKTVVELLFEYHLFSIDQNG
jgi:hypothetical protein